jgi:hypothetical protein
MEHFSYLQKISTNIIENLLEEIGKEKSLISSVANLYHISEIRCLSILVPSVPQPVEVFSCLVSCSVYGERIPFFYVFCCWFFWL